MKKNKKGNCSTKKKRFEYKTFIWKMELTIVIIIIVIVVIQLHLLHLGWMMYGISNLVLINTWKTTKQKIVVRININNAWCCYMLYENKLDIDLYLLASLFDYLISPLKVNVARSTINNDVTDRLAENLKYCPFFIVNFALHSLYVQRHIMFLCIPQLNKINWSNSTNNK